MILNIAKKYSKAVFYILLMLNNHCYLIIQHAQRQQVEKKRIHDEFNIATGLFRSNKSVFAIGAIGGGRSTSGPTETPREAAQKESTVKQPDDDRALTAIPIGQGIGGSSTDKQILSDKPMQKRILRKVN